MGYLSRRALQGLKAYQYKAGGYTWLDDLHQPFWKAIVEALPMWLAPNLITLIGSLGVFCTYLVASYYSPDMEGDRFAAAA